MRQKTILKQLSSLLFYPLFIISLSFCAKDILAAAGASSIGSKVVVMRVANPIGPAIQGYIQRGIAKADSIAASAVVLEIDTPGGLDSSMRAIVKDILRSKVPVISFVAPSGARAASAGTFILYASAIAAMAPGTNLGAASPVSIGGAGRDAAKPDNTKKPSDSTVLKSKVRNDAIAYIRSLAQLNKRNVDFAVAAVSKAATMTAKEALKNNVINVVAADIPSLLNKVNNSSAVVNGKIAKIKINNPQLITFNQDWRTRFLAVITNPSIAYFLLLAGVYGLFFEFLHPGIIAPGVIGAICLLIGAYALQLLPVNYVGLGLVVLGIGFMIAEAFVASFGALGLGGVVAFVVGSLLLFDTSNPAMQVNRPAIIAVAIVSLAFFVGISRIALKARKRPLVSGSSTLLGQVANLELADDGKFYVFLQSERWQVYSAFDLQAGQKVKVVQAKGTLLEVEPISKQE